MTGVLIKKGQRHTGIMSCDDRGRDQSDAAASQGMLSINGHQQYLVRKGRIIPRVSEGTWPCGLGLVASRTVIE